MKSSSGAYFIALDEIRALAVFMIIAWHFTHGGNGYPVPFEYVPAIFPFALLDEGHVGVAIFMTLSGYLFAKLLDGKRINYVAFIWNRILRLIPLLAVVLLMIGLKKFIHHEGVGNYALLIVKGIIFPVLPHGAWVVTVEFHFYLVVLPLFLWLLHKSKLLPFCIIAAAIALRSLLYYQRGEIQSLAYSTIIGRVDQFALGMLAFSLRSLLVKRHLIAAITIIGFMMFYWAFDAEGGFNRFPSYPSPSPIWIILPTIEGFACGVFIAWYDNSFAHRINGATRFIARIGEFSYSIYLLHFFVVFRVAQFINERIMNISNFYLACVWSLIFLILMVPVAYLSFRFVESPFLKLRKRYIVTNPGSSHQSEKHPTEQATTGA